MTGFTSQKCEKLVCTIFLEQEDFYAPTSTAPFVKQRTSGWSVHRVIAHVMSCEAAFSFTCTQFSLFIWHCGELVSTSPHSMKVLGFNLLVHWGLGVSLIGYSKSGNGCSSLCLTLWQFGNLSSVFSAAHLKWAWISSSVYL